MKISAASLAILCGFLGVWQLGEKLSPDALGVMVGLIFGALAGIPAALLVLYAVRNSPPAETPPTPHTRWIIVERPAEYPAGALTGNVYSEDDEREQAGRWPARRRGVKC